MSMPRLPVLAAALLSVATTTTAQQSERAVFLLRLGADTLAVETVSIGAGRASGELRMRSPLLRLRSSFTLTPEFDTRAVDVAMGFGSRGDSAVSRFVITVGGDSASIVTGAQTAGVAPPTRTAWPKGAVYFTNLSGLAIELITRRARALGGDTAVVPLFLGSGQSVDARVIRVGADSMVLSIARVEFRIRTDTLGRMLGAAIPSQHAVIERLSGDSPVADWTPVAVSYDAPAGAPYEALPATVRTPAGITLTGTLTMPSHAGSARVPAVVMITGSGAQDRDESTPLLSQYHPFREIADTLSRRGIAVLRLDDRGVGGSSPGPVTATSADYADDIRAAVAWLRARHEIDPARVGLVGHSEGGVIGPMVAATDPALRALVIIAGTARTGRDLSNAQRRYEIEHSAAIAPAARDSAYNAGQRAVDSSFAAPGWWHFFAAYDPLPTARRVRTRTLILQGETDTQVAPEQAAMLGTAMREGGNREVTVRTFPRMNHLMLDDPSGDFAGYRRLPSYRVRRDFLGALADWLALEL